MGAERCVSCSGCVSICMLAHGSGENSMSHSYLYSHLYSPGRPLRAWQTARGAVEQGKGWAAEPQSRNNKGPGIKFVAEKAKG